MPFLGAGTGSRLFLNIRERKGYAYDVYSSVGALREAGTFFGGAQTRTEVTARAIKEMLAEFDRLATVKVGHARVAKRKELSKRAILALALDTRRRRRADNADLYARSWARLSRKLIVHASKR